MNAKKINCISDFNSLLDDDYKSLNQSSDSWYPIMYYDETIDLEKKRFITVGINPSLTVNAKKYINKKILKINEYSVKYEKKEDEKDNCGNLRFDKFSSNKDFYKKELINYQKEIKYSKKPISYFKFLDYFFQAVKIDFEEDVFHYDFCQRRNTDSVTIGEWLSKNKYSNFNRLIHHLDQIIQLIQPKYVFIFNASLVEMLMEKNFFDKNLDLKKIGKDFQLYNEYINDDGVCTRKDTKFIIGNQLSGGATSRVYRANLIANVNRLINK
mgnify:FL=1|tara:strand:- start:1953 stop:2759 length:807 start_codon:yes stop_codon:yes gene_type:complete